MNFFEQQTQARRKTFLLLFLCAIAVACIVALVYLVTVECLYLYARYFRSSIWEHFYAANRSVPSLQLWNPDLLMFVSGVVLLIVLGGSIYKIKELAQGGASVMRMLGGVAIQPNTDDLDEKKVLNVVEEMALASGTAVPPVYLLKGESGINAFAAGLSSGDAAIGVTQGCLKLLSRDELQGVIAHEFSHIFNGDMRLNLRMMGLLHGMLVIAVIGQMLLRSVEFTGSHRFRVKAPGPIIILVLVAGLLLHAVGYIGVFFAQLIKSAISREREFLADASAVQFTRHPLALAGALKKIGGLHVGSRVFHPRAEEASHLFFAKGVGGGFLNLLATHPPLAKRILFLDPSFDGKFPQVEPLKEENSFAAGQIAVPPSVSPKTRLSLSAQSVTGRAVLPEQITASVGRPATEHLAYAVSLLDELPEMLKSQARDPVGAPAILFLLLMNKKNPEARKKQMDYLFGNANNYIYQQARKLSEPVESLEASKILPLADMALPTLRLMSQQQYGIFRKNVMDLIQPDGHLELNEFVLKQIIFHHLDAHFGGMQTNRVLFRSLDPLWLNCVELLSLLAWVGCPEREKAEGVFREAVESLAPGRSAELISQGGLDLTKAEQSLARLATASFEIKEKFIKACVLAIRHDGLINTEEIEVIRAFSDSLDCPLPPVLMMAAS